MKIVGADLSLCNTGIAVAVDGTITWDVLSPPKGMRDIPRLDWIARNVGERARGADLVVVEDFSFASKGAAIYQIGGMAFMVRHRLWRMQVKYAPVAPSTLKKFVCGKGNADKAQMMKEVWKRFGHDSSDDNAADAIGLCYIGLALTGGWMATIDPQREVVKDLRKKYSDLLEPWMSRVPADSMPLFDGVVVK